MSEAAYTHLHICEGKIHDVISLTLPGLLGFVNSCNIITSGVSACVTKAPGSFTVVIFLRVTSSLGHRRFMQICIIIEYKAPVTIGEKVFHHTSQTVSY